MSFEAVRNLINNLDSKIIDNRIGNPAFRDPSVKTYPLNKDGFRIIRKVKSPRKCVFIDGGNQELAGAPNFSVQINRVYFSIWVNDKSVRERILPKRIEFFSSTYSTILDKEIFYGTSVFPSLPDQKIFLPEEGDLSFNSFDSSIAYKNQRADIERVASISRRFAEWHIAEKIVLNELDKGDIVVLDGTLQTNFKNEEKYMSKLFKAAKDKGVIISGFSKTSGLLTDTGLSLLGAVDKIASDHRVEHEWYYPIAEASSLDHNAVILAVKLCAGSNRIYRYEIQGDCFKGMNEIELNEVLSELVYNSCDVTFPGYPYGLVDADRLARVSYDEAEYYRGALLSQLSEVGKLEKFTRHMRAKDSHSILNMLVK